MLSKRIIACLDVRDGQVVKGVNFEGLRSAGDPAARDRFAVYARSGQSFAHDDAVEWAHEAEQCGAGEILLTSIDRDGTKIGFDCPMNAAVSAAVSIPVIASGGAGALDHFVDVFTT